MSKKTATIIIIGLLLLTGCGVSTPAGTSAPKTTSTPAGTFTPSPAPTEILPASQGTPMPTGKIITPENMGQISLLAKWGKGTINDMSYSPDGKTLAAGSSMGIYFYDTTTFKQIAFLETRKGVSSLAFSPTDKTLAVGFNDGDLNIIQVSDWEVISSFTLPYTMPKITFSPDGKLIAASGSILKDEAYNGIVGLISVVDNILSGEDSKYSLYSTNVQSASFSPDGNILAIGGASGEIYLVQVSDFTDIKTLLLKTGYGFYGQIMSIAFSPDGKYLVSGNNQGTAQIIRTEDDKLLHLMQPQMTLGLFEMISVNSISFSPDGSLIVTGAQDGTVRIWDLTGGQVRSLHEPKGAVQKALFSPDGQVVAAYSQIDGNIRFWQVSSGALIHTISAGSSQIMDVRFSPDNQLLAAALLNSTAQIWKVGDGNSLQTIAVNEGAVYGISFSPDGQTLATGSETGSISIWNVTDGKLISQPRLNGGATIYSVEFSPDGNILAWGDTNVILWKQGQATVRLEDGQHAIDGIAFSSDGKFLVSKFLFDTRVQLWQVDEKKVLQTFNIEDLVYCIGLSPDGQMIAAGYGGYGAGYGDGDGKINLWRASDGKLLFTLINDGFLLNHLTFSPDGKILAGASPDGTTKLWSVSDGKLIKTIQGHNDSVAGVDFSPNGLYLATGSFDGVVRIWGIR